MHFVPAPETAARFLRLEHNNVPPASQLLWKGSVRDVVVGLHRAQDLLWDLGRGRVEDIARHEF